MFVTTPSSTADTACFGTAVCQLTRPNSIGTWKFGQDDGYVNLGITITETGESVAFLESATKDDALWIDGIAGVEYGARASTWGIPRLVDFIIGVECD